MLTISNNQLEIVRFLIQQYMHESMLYKLGVSPSITKSVDGTSFNYLKNIDLI